MGQIFFCISGQIGGKNSQKIMDTKIFSKFFHKNQTFCVKIRYIPQNFSKRRKMERRRHFLRLTGEKFSPVKRKILRKKLSLSEIKFFEPCVAKKIDKKNRNDSRCTEFIEHNSLYMLYYEMFYAFCFSQLRKFRE